MEEGARAERDKAAREELEKEDREHGPNIYTDSKP
jgi:hypothetical protein